MNCVESWLNGFCHKIVLRECATVTFGGVKLESQGRDHLTCKVNCGMHR